MRRDQFYGSTTLVYRYLGDALRDGEASFPAQVGRRAASGRHGDHHAGVVQGAQEARLLRPHLESEHEAAVVTLGCRRCHIPSTLHSRTELDGAW